MTIYTNGPTLFLQSVEEHRHLGGLFAVTAEWLRPRGSSELPQSIPTSLGEIDIFPEPAVSVGTDGFERITATGYDIWDQSTYESRGVTTGEITASIRVFTNPTTDPVSGQTFYDTAYDEKTFSGYIFDVAHLKKMRRKGTPALPPAPILKVRNSDGAEITQFNVPINLDISYTGTVEKTIQITNVNVTNYGAVEEVEVVYSITQALVSVSQPVP